MSGPAQPSSLGKYEIRGTLGKGAMGIVYDGWDPVIDRRVAIKTMRLPEADEEEAIEALARFKREAQAAGRLTHPNIVGVFDYGEADAVAYIVMEFVEGRSLKEMLGANERMSATSAATLMEDVLAGLAYSHGRGVVHRDIKPANIMMTLENRAKIADFGIARIEASSMTQAGTVLGTPAYMSPEQFMGQVVDRRTDIYSCGVMLYQLLTGDRPFDGSMTAIMHKALTTTPPRPSELAVTSPPALDGVVARAMARRPEDRFDNAADFAEALRAAISGNAIIPTAFEDPFASDETIVAPRAAAPARPPAPAPIPAKAPPLPAAPVKRGGKMPVMVGAGVGLAVVAGAIVWLVLPKDSPPVTPMRQASTQPATVAPVILESPPAPVLPASPVAASPIAASPVTASPVAAPPVVVAPIVPPPSIQPAINPTPPAKIAAPPPPVAAPIVEAINIPPPAPKRSAAMIEAALTSALSGVRCSFTHASTGDDGAATVTGIAGTGPPEEAARLAIAAANPASAAVRVHSFSGPFCPALDLLRPIGDMTSGGRVPMEIAQVGGPASLRDNDVISLQVTMPGFAGYLHVAYLQSDATVSSLVPGDGYPLRTFAAHALVDLGKPRADYAGWHVGPPFGTDMIVAIASTAPLFTKALPDSQPIASYLAGLQAAMDDLRRHGGTLAVSATVLDTSPAG